MKKCPFCAEDIQDEAIKCRYCGSMLPASSGAPEATMIGAPASQPPTPATEPATEGATEPATDPATEPAAEAAGPAEQDSKPPAVAASPAGQPLPSSQTEAHATASPPAAAVQGIQFSYTGQRFVLGYGGDFYGIWDRLAPGAPIQRFPRTDEGWRAAWLQYSAWEPGAQPVSQVPGSGRMATAAPAAAPMTGQGPAWSPPVQRRTNGMAIASLVLGIVWVYWIGSILALIFGYIAKSEIDRSRGAQTGRGMAIAGIVLGYVGLAALVITVIVAVANSNSV